MTDFFEYIISGVVAIVGYFLRDTHNTVKRIEKELHDHQLYDANNYVRKDELASLRADLFKGYEAINMRLGEIENYLRTYYDRRHSDR